MPVAPICLPPLDSTNAAPNAVGFKVEAGPGLRVHPAVTSMRETAKSVRQGLVCATIVGTRSSLRDLRHSSHFSPALKRWAKLARPSGAVLPQPAGHLFLRLLLAGALLGHQECGQSAGIFVVHVAVWFDGAGPHGLRVLQPMVNPGSIQARAYLG